MTTTDCTQIARDMRDTIEKYFDAVAEYDAAYQDYIGGHDTPAEENEAAEKLMMLAEVIYPDTTPASADDCPDPQDVADRDHWEEHFGVLEITQHATRSGMCADWQLDSIDVVLTIGGPHVEIVADDQNAMVRAYWAGDHGTAIIDFAAARQALADLFEMFDQQA